MKQVGLRLPDDLHAEFVEWAKREKRSLHAQLRWIVQHAMDEAGPDHYSDACYCPKCTLYDGHRQPKPKQPPAPRHPFILPEMTPLLQQWLDAIKARVGTLIMEVPLWLSRKRGKGVCGGRYRGSNIGISSCPTAKRCSCQASTGMILGRTAAVKR